MGKISTYAIDGTPSLNDKVIGTDVNDNNITKNYTISDILSLGATNGLQEVLDIGNTSTTPFTITTETSFCDITNLIVSNSLRITGNLRDSINALNDGTKVLGSTGAGLPLWVSPSAIALSPQLVIQTSSPNGQDPAGLDTPLQVSFGTGVGTISDPVMTSTGGDITFNEVGTYFVNATGSVSRTGSSSGVAVFLFRALLDGVQFGSVGAVLLDTPGLTSPEILTFPLVITSPGTVLTFEVLRDSSGVNFGGLYPTLTSSSWDDAPSTTLSIWKIV